MRYVLARLSFYGPFFSHIAGTVSGRGPSLPPPSTLAGALLAAYYRSRGPAEAKLDKRLLETIKLAYFWAPPYAVAPNLSRHYTFLVQKKHRVMRMKESRELLSLIFSPNPTYETYFWGDAYVLYVLDGEFERGLEEAVGHIFRIGHKETLVASVPVEVISKRRVDMAKTRFYVPRDSTTSECSNVEKMLEVLGDPVELIYEKHALREYCVPPQYTDEPLFCDPAPGWAAVELETEAGIMQVLLPERYV